MTSSPKVLHVLNELRFSGAEFMLASAAEWMSGGRGVILSTGERPGEFADELARCGYEIVHIPFEKSIRFFRNVSKLMRDGAFDVVHLHTERASIWYALLAAIHRIPTVRTVHSVFGFEGFLRIRRKLGRQLMKAIGVSFVACSRRVQRNERSRFGIPSHMISNWIDPARLHPISADQQKSLRERLKIAEGDFVTISIANEAPAKNLPALFHAISTSLPCHVHLHVGAVSPALAELAEKSEGGRIMLLGSTPDIAPYLSISDAFVCSSIYEGGQLVLLEAACFGLFCLTTNVGLADDFEHVPGVHFMEPDAESIREGLSFLQALNGNDRTNCGHQLSQFALSRYVPAVGGGKYRSLYSATGHRS